MATLFLPSTVYDTPEDGMAMTVMVARAPLDVMRSDSAHDIAMKSHDYLTR